MNSSALAARFVSGPRITASSNAEQRLGDWFAELEPQQAAEIGAWLDLSRNTAYEYVRNLPRLNCGGRLIRVPKAALRPEA